jgi:hypothetical protein
MKNLLNYPFLGDAIAFEVKSSTRNAFSLDRIPTGMVHFKCPLTIRHFKLIRVSNSFGNAPEMKLVCISQLESFENDFLTSLELLVQKTTQVEGFLNIDSQKEAL